jgi:peptide/nickel transport system permease protein
MVASIPESVTAEPRSLNAGVRLALGAFLRRPTGLIGLLLTLPAVLAALLANLAPHDPVRVRGPALAPPSVDHLMGTDGLGRDLFSGVLFGARTSLLVAAGVGLIALVAGVAVGSVAGTVGGRVDDLIMRFTEIVQVVPRFFFAILAMALFGTSQTVLVTVLGLTSWVILARVVRAEVMALKERDFVISARASGASRIHVLSREVLPNALPVTIVYLSLLLAQVILLESSLSFLGLGDPNTVSWGYLAGQAQPFLRAAWWLALFPGLAITITVIGLNLIGDALTDVMGRRG